MTRQEDDRLGVATGRWGWETGKRSGWVQEEASASVGKNYCTACVCVNQINQI